MNPYVLFFGHALGWGPVAVDYILSSWGATRILGIFFFVPLCIAYFERTVKRPSRLRNLKVEEIHHLSKPSFNEEVPRGDSAFVSASQYQDIEDEEDVHLLQGAISLWRARVDRTVLRLSWR